MEIVKNGLKIRIDDNVSYGKEILKLIENDDFQSLKELCMKGSFPYIFYVDDRNEMGFYTSNGNYTMDEDGKLIFSGYFKKFERALEDIINESGIKPYFESLFAEENENLRSSSLMIGIKKTISNLVISSNFTAMPKDILDALNN